MVERSGMDVDRRQIATSLAAPFGVDEPDLSLSECRQRLRALRAVLMDLPHHALRLLRRIAKRSRRGLGLGSPRFDDCRSVGLCGWRRAVVRVERPPDKVRTASLCFSPPPG